MDDVVMEETTEEVETAAPGPDMGPMPEIPAPTESIPTKKVQYLQDCLRKLLKAIVGKEPPEIVPADTFKAAGPRWTQPVPAPLAAVVMQLAAVIERVATEPHKARFASVNEDSFATISGIDLVCTMMEMATKDKKMLAAVKDVLMGGPPKAPESPKPPVDGEPPAPPAPGKKSMIERAA